MSDQNILRQIPQVERILNLPEIISYEDLLGRALLVVLVRNEIEHFREDALSGKDLKVDDLIRKIIDSCERMRLERLQRVINGTGVVIHTNLGRAPITESILDSLKEIAGSYCNLEYYIPLKKRGRRGGLAESVISELTGAEDALIVNNNASSVFLILNEFACGKEVVVSRGELIQIGGGFRIPDIMRSSGALLHEVGTTNITDLEDFREALNENTSMILSAHQSNYRIKGFTRSPGLSELASLKNRDIILVRDMGSGNLVQDQRLDQPFENTVQQEVQQGPDLLCFSGDKLLGSSQAGIIIGKKDLISRLRSNPLMRMIRVDKITYYILQETLIKYAGGKHEELALWSVLFQDRSVLLKRRRRLLSRVHHSMKKAFIRPIDTRATYGGGSMPDRDFPSLGISIDLPGVSADEAVSFFLNNKVPVLGSVVQDTFILDMYTVFDKDLDILAECITNFLDSNNRPGN